MRTAVCEEEDLSIELQRKTKFSQQPQSSLDGLTRSSLQAFHRA